MAWFSDEVWTLAVVEYLRLCVLFNLTSDVLLPPDAAREKNADFDVLVDEYDRVQIAASLRQRCDGVVLDEEAIGWELSYITNCLQDDGNLGRMNMGALNDLCCYLKVDILDILSAYFRCLGRPLP